MQLTEKQRKTAWIVAGVLGVVYFGPSIIHGVWRAVMLRQASAYAVKPSPVRVAPPVMPTTSPAPGTASDPNAAHLLGNWQGGADLPDRGRCVMTLQVKRDPDRAGVFDGYETVHCLQSGVLVGNPANVQNRARDISNASSPTSVIMSGPIANSSIDFHIDRLVGIPVNGCKITAYSIVSFGDGAIAAEWKNAPCPDGNLILRHPGNNLF
jgi:hypothetical protein